MKLVIDSNVFVAALDPKDLFHDECMPIFRRILDSDIEALCPCLVLAETTCVLRRRTSSESVAVAVYKHLAQVPSINWLDVTLAVAERASLLGARTGLRGGDALVLQVAEQYGVPLLTKDQEMKKRAPAGILVFEPTDLRR
ncbi:MAG: type II toxin-antitoxin system VapC family toxin [Candidatus Riflebacteria bacterium]|nr:type II toxin-antitoxin system VapC family toxin [Candidatus Riflebacteria bacterium]